MASVITVFKMRDTCIRAFFFYEEGFNYLRYFRGEHLHMQIHVYVFQNKFHTPMANASYTELWEVLCCIISYEKQGFQLSETLYGDATALYGWCGTVVKFPTLIMLLIGYHGRTVHEVIIPRKFIWGAPSDHWVLHPTTFRSQMIKCILGCKISAYSIRPERHI